MYIGWVGVYPDETFFMCSVQGLLKNFSNLSSGFWNVNICLYVTLFILSTACTGTKGLPGRKYEFFSYFGWIFALFVSIYGFFIAGDGAYFYGPLPGGIYCWMNDQFVVERVTLHYLYLFIFLGLMVVLVTINLIYLCCNAGNFGEEIDKRIGKLIFTLIGYPAIYALIFGPLGFARIVDAFGGRSPIEFAWFAALLISANGGINALYYGMSRNLYKRWKLELKGKTKHGKKTAKQSHSEQSESYSLAMSSGETSESGSP
eukprot:TRINITY_DN2628_c0_g2_i2.p1 TRINITY_DN2628_c0_g2~~TRINITY_DN2628_c0_g2_i2.p1  ORF type:complete len:260 (-),score=42.80 TRINITY_DN2628_c0_g2_i2:46-825(-)